MTPHKTTHPVVRAGLGIAALVLIAFLSNWLISLTSFGTRGADFTQDKVHTLSAGTKSILGKLDAPVKIRFYASRKTEALPRETKNFIRRVDDILKEYVNLSNGKLRVENLDPQPDTDDEDSAQLDNVQTQNINQYENVSLGLAVSCLDQATPINIDPFDTAALDEQETMFEYNLSRAISEVSAPVKPVLGIMSALAIKGEAPMMPGQPPQQGWMLYQQLAQSYKITDVELTATEIPADVKVLLLIHPANITPDAEYAIDQFLMKGGTLIAALDSYSFDAAQGGNPMGGGSTIPTSSTLPTLLPAWNITFDSVQSVADPKYKTMLRGNRAGLAVLSLPKESMPDKENVLTKNLNDLFFVLAGVFTNKGNNGLESNILVKTSDQSGFIDSTEAAQFAPDTPITGERRSRDLALHLRGTFKTAFPNGKPKSSTDAPEPEKKDGDKKPESLKESVAPANVFLLADTDAFSNQGAYRVQNMGGGMQAAMPYNGNSVLLLNIIDQAASSSDLIGARSRASIRRPFTRIRDMESAAEDKVGKDIEAFRKEEQAAQARLNELQQQKTNSKDLFASPEQEAEIKKLREQQVDYARKIRDKQKDLKREKDKLTGRITMLNLAVVPGIVLLAGLIVLLARRRSARAR